MGLMSRLASGTRTIQPSSQAVVRKVPQGSAAGMQSAIYSTPGVPEYPLWDGMGAVENGYFGQLYVMRAARTVADALAGLPFRTGPDPTKPDKYNLTSPLARLLGPAPGGPNTTTSARALWTWSIVQRLITGRYAWELEADTQGRCAALWPLLSTYLQPIPSGSSTGPHWTAFRYNLPRSPVDIPAARVHYGWRQSQRDWWQPESVLEAAGINVSVAIGIERYNWALLRNNMVATTLVSYPPFDDPAEEQAWQDQFLTSNTGYDNAGRVAFVAVEQDSDPVTGKAASNAGVQVERLATTAEDAQLAVWQQRSQDTILEAFGVPRSMLGNSSERTFANADTEHRNFWTGTVLQLASEICDEINIGLAPRLGDEVGWFDFSRVEALKAAKLFAGMSIPDLLANDVASIDEIRTDIGLPARDPSFVPDEELDLPSTEDTPGATDKASLGGGTRDVGGPMLESGSAGALLPKAPITGQHLYRQATGGVCATCGLPITAPTHLARMRHGRGKKTARSGPQADLEHVLGPIRARQQIATASRLRGHRGQRMRQSSPVDARTVFDPTFWTARLLDGGLDPIRSGRLVAATADHLTAVLAAGVAEGARADDLVARAGLVFASRAASTATERRQALHDQRQRLYDAHSKPVLAAAAELIASVDVPSLARRLRGYQTPDAAHSDATSALTWAATESGSDQPWQQTAATAAAAAGLLGAATASASTAPGPPTLDAVDAALGSAPAPAVDSGPMVSQQLSAWATDVTRAARAADTDEAAVEAAEQALSDQVGVAWWLEDQMHQSWGVGFSVTATSLGLAVNYVAYPDACFQCLDNAAGSPYGSAGDAPFIPAHGKCRCSLEAAVSVDALAA